VETVSVWRGSWGFAPSFGAVLDRQMPRAMSCTCTWSGTIPSGREPVRQCATASRSSARERPARQMVAGSEQMEEAHLSSGLRHGDPSRLRDPVHERGRSGELASRDWCCRFVRDPERRSRTGLLQTAAARSLRQRFPELAGRRLVLFLGRLHPKKQPEY